jgi:hypothetical protein
MGVHPTPAAVFRAIVEHVAALAQRRQLMERAVTGVVVEVRAGQYHRRPSTVYQNVLGRPSHAATLPVAPTMPLAVPPSSVPEMKYSLSVRPPAMFAGASCPHKTNMMRELRPVDRVQEHVLGSDRHQASPSEAPGCRALGITEPALRQSTPDRAWHDDT